MHVFSDLMPYICTFDGCKHELTSFPKPSSWADHEFQHHRFIRYWVCPECSRESCSTLDWEQHLNDAHNQKFLGPNLIAARIIACRIRPKRAEEEECPLCRVVLGKPRRAFVRHVSRHMEDIALMALPSNAEEDSETGTPYLETPNRSDKSMQHASVSIDGKLEVLRPQKPVNARREKGRYTPAESEAIKMKRKTGACSDCRKAKRKVSVLAGSRFSTVTNTCLVYTCPARRLNES